MRSTVLLVCCLTGSLSAAEPSSHKLAKHLFNRPSLARVGAGAVWGQIWNRPHEWGRGLAGLGKRSASGLGQHLVAGTVQFGVAAWHHEDLRYYPSQRNGFGPRLKYALLSTIVARKSTGPGNTAALGRISGATAGGFISRLWQPARLHTFASGLSSSGISLGFNAGFNVTREFWPEIRHPHGPPTRPPQQ